MLSDIFENAASVRKSIAMSGDLAKGAMQKYLEQDHKKHRVRISGNVLEQSASNTEIEAIDGNAIKTNSQLHTQACDSQDEPDQSETKSVHRQAAVCSPRLGPPGLGPLFVPPRVCPTVWALLFLPQTPF